MKNNTLMLAEMMKNLLYATLFTLLLALGVAPRSGLAQNVIINEWSQGRNAGGPYPPNTSCSPFGEWVELLVVGPGPTTLTGFTVFDDGSATGQPLYTFKADPLWTNVCPGTLIVVYNGDLNILVAPGNTACRDSKFPAANDETGA